MTDVIPPRTARPRPETGSRRHRDHDEPTETDRPDTTPPVPRFGLTYVVSAAARFDPPHEVLGRYLTDGVALVDDVEALMSQVRLVQTGAESEIVRTTNGFRCTLTAERALVEERPTAGSVRLDTRMTLDDFTTILSRWRVHLREVPEQLDRVSAEAAAAQRRVATLSWLESGVAMAAGNGWSHEAAQLDGISRAIAGGAREQVGAMRDAGESWSRLREELSRRRRDDSQLDAVVTALDHLLGAN